MLVRTIILNPVEPALLSVRSALGVDLDLGISFLAQDGSAVDPASLLPQLALMPRSSYGMLPYDVDGTGNVSVPGVTLIDPAGYTIELYQRRVADNPDDPPVAVSLIAKGVLRLEGSAYINQAPKE